MNIRIFESSHSIHRKEGMDSILSETSLRKLPRTHFSLMKTYSVTVLVFFNIFCDIIVPVHGYRSIELRLTNRHSWDNTTRTVINIMMNERNKSKLDVITNRSKGCSSISDSICNYPRRWSR